MIMRNYLINLTQYMKETAQYFALIVPLLTIWMIVEANILVVNASATTLSWYGWILLIYLMKEISFWMFIKEHQILSELILKSVRIGRVEKIQRVFGSVKNMILSVRVCTKLLSWLFMFIMLSTFFRAASITVDSYSIAVMGILFYFAMEFRTLLKAAYVDYTVKKVEQSRKKKEHKMQNKKR